MKRQVDWGRKETKDWKRGDQVILSTRDLIFKERPARKLDQYIGPYVIEEVVSTNTVKLRLPTSMRIHPVVNVSQIVQYKEQVGGQKRKEGKPIEIKRVEEWEVERILNKRKVRGVEKYLVQWKGLTVENNIWEKKENLENTKKLVDEFKGRLKVEVRQQEWEEYKRSELPGRYMARVLYGWDDGKFEAEYLRKLDRNWRR